MKFIFRIYISIYHQGASAFICTHLSIRQSHVIAIHIFSYFLRTVIEICVKLRTSLRINPPLPCRQNILNIDIGPFCITADFTIYKVLHTFSYIEIGIEGSTINYGTFCGKICYAGPVSCISNFHIRTGISTLISRICGIRFHTGEKHSLTLCNHPLIIGILKLAVIQISLIEIRRCEKSHTALQILCSIIMGIEFLNICSRTMSSIKFPL